jgi:DNA invertase Pin-like site-specific DNA recombinase
MYSHPLFRYAKIGRRQAQEVAEKVSLALVVSLQEAFDTSTSTGILLFQVVGAIAEFERSLIRERIALGLERARAEGKTIGRPLGAQVDEQELRCAVKG